MLDNIVTHESIEYETNRLKMETYLFITENGEIIYPSKDIFENDGRYTSFMYYNKDKSETICSIGFNDKHEVSFETNKKYRRQGYMKEALISLIDWIFENTNIKQIDAIVNMYNEASINTLLSCGFMLNNEYSVCDTYHYYVKNN